MENHAQRKRWLTTKTCNLDKNDTTKSPNKHDFVEM